MAERSNIKKIDVSKLVVDRSVNFRDDYDLPSMMDEIIKAGGILEPVHVRGEDMVVLKGNRRTAAAQELLKNPSIAADLKESISKIDCIIYHGLTEKETTEIVLDHGSQKPLSRVEVVKAVWRLVAQMYTFPEICVIMFHLVAKLTGNVKKAHEAQSLPPGPGRVKFLRDWLKGTVDDYLIAAHGMGEFVREQLLLTETSLDRDLTAEEKQRFKMECSRKRIGELRTAKKEDKESPEGWTPEKGGAKFNALIEKYIKADETGSDETEDGLKKPSKAEMVKASEGSSSKLAQLAYKSCAGDATPAERHEILNLDAEYARRDRVFESIKQNLDRINKTAKFSGGEVHEVLRLILNGAPQQFEEYVVRFNAK